MKKRLLSLSLKLAKDKLVNHPERSHYAHYSFIVQNNKIVEWATNVNFEPPIHYGYHTNSDPSFCPKFHAEIFAYKRARGILDDESFEVINIRLNKTGSVRLSKPCKHCFRFMKAMNCRKFYYSSEAGFLTLKS